MSIKDQTAALLKRLEDGTAQIWEQYKKRVDASAAGYRQKAKELEQDYAEAANQASARAKIDLNNTLEKMADHGYIRSGETVQARISGNAAKNSALGKLAAQKEKDKNALNLQQMQTETELSAAAQKEAAALRNQVLDQIRDQENRDREYQMEVEQNATANRLAQEKLELEKSRVAAEIAKEEAAAKEKAEEKATNGGITPQKNVYDYLNDIVKKNTKTVAKKGYKVVDRKGIFQAVTSILKDKSLSYQYRYELYLYAKSMGYVSDEL